MRQGVRKTTDREREREKKKIGKVYLQRERKIERKSPCVSKERHLKREDIRKRPKREQNV